MRFVSGVVLLLVAATPAFAIGAAAPAPLIGLGIPALGVIGGAVLGSKFLRRK